MQGLITSAFVNCCTLHHKNSTHLVVGRFKGTVKLTSGLRKGQNYRGSGKLESGSI